MNNCLKSKHKLNFRVLSNKLLSQTCLLCAAKAMHDMSLCHDCIKNLPCAPDPCCIQCGLQTLGHTCGHCLKTKPYYDTTDALYTYAYPVDILIQQYKYKHALHLSNTFSHLLLRKMPNIDIDLIIPMPLHPTRMKDRGFNQSLEIAKSLAKKTNIRLDSVSCTRVKNTQPQASLTPKERVKNMRDAFHCSTKLSGLRIAVIDDVMTTGASLNALSKTLKMAGASKISCYIIARTA